MLQRSGALHDRLNELLDDAEVAEVAAAGLKKTLLMFDYFNDVAEKAKAGKRSPKPAAEKAVKPGAETR